jgi:hypothetical protein
VIAGHITGVPMIGLAWGMAEAIPDRFPPPIFSSRTLDLIRGCGRSPGEAGRESCLGQRGALFFTVHIPELSTPVVPSSPTAPAQSQECFYALAASDCRQAHESVALGDWAFAGPDLLLAAHQ